MQPRPTCRLAQSVPCRDVDVARDLTRAIDGSCEEPSPAVLVLTSIRLTVITPGCVAQPHLRRHTGSRTDGRIRRRSDENRAQPASNVNGQPRPTTQDGRHAAQTHTGPTSTVRLLTSRFGLHLPPALHALGSQRTSAPLKSARPRQRLEGPFTAAFA